MNVDRVKYLSLVTAIAAAGCVVTEKTEKESDGGGGVGGTAGQGGTAGAEQGGAGGVGGATGGSGGVATGGGGGAGGASCDDTVGTPAACTTVASDCEPYCNAAHTNLKPAVAEAAVECLALDQSAYCLTGYSCISQALADACPDPSTQSDCATVATNCSEPGDPACEDVLDGLNSTGRAEVMSCVDDGCTFGLYSCMEGASFINP